MFCGPASGATQTAESLAADEAATLVYRSSGALARARAARKLADDGPHWGPPKPGVHATAVGLVEILDGDGDAKVARAASRALRELALAQSLFLDDMLHEGLLPAVSKALVASVGTAPPSLGDAGNLLHALCRLVKDSEEALTSMGALTDLADAVGAALLVAAAAPPPPPPAVGASKRGRPQRTAPATEDDPAAVAAAEDAEEDDDAVEQGADLADELWQRLPLAPQPVWKRWAQAMLPGLLALARHDNGAYPSLRALVNMLGCERLRAVSDEESGAGGADGDAKTPLYDGPLTRAAMPGTALAVSELLRKGNPASLSSCSGKKGCLAWGSLRDIDPLRASSGVLDMAAILARRRAPPPPLADSTELPAPLSPAGGAHALLAAGK